MTSSGTDVFAEVEALGVIPVVEVEDAAHAVPLARTLAEAGLPVLEVTYRTPAAGDAIAAIAAELPDFLLGAGTLLTPEAVAAAVSAGAQFGVSPGLSLRCIAAAQEYEFLFIPGTWIAPRSDIAQGRWEEIAERARAVATLSRSVEAS